MRSNAYLLHPFSSAGRRIPMDWNLLLTQDILRWMLAILTLSVYFSLARASQEETQVGWGSYLERSRSMQVTLAGPRIPSELSLSPPSLTPPFISSNQTPCVASPHLNILDSSGQAVSPPSNVPKEDSSNEFLVMSYYPDWVANTLPPSKVDWKRFDWIDFAFAVPAANLTLEWDDPGAPKMLTTLVDLVHSAGSKVKLSIGGWTGSKHFSSAVASNKSRTTLVYNIVDAYTSFGVDGIDIDWEYPGKEGASRHFHAKDTANFLKFLQLLRTSLPAPAVISAAVETTAFVGDSGEPVTDLSEFAKVLDWVLLMNYDAWGSSSNPGPNAPLHDACNNSTQPDVNAVSAFNAWTAAKFPANKLVLGLPSYGYVSSSTAQRLRTRSKPYSTKESNFTTAIGDEDGGQIQFREMVDQGIIIRSTNSSGQGNTKIPSFTGSNGFERFWDACSDTPYLRSIASGQIVSYDDPESLALKAAFAKAVGMRGINIFDVSGDTGQWDLIDAVRRSVTSSA